MFVMNKIKSLYKRFNLNAFLCAALIVNCSIGPVNTLSLICLSYEMVSRPSLEVSLQTKTIENIK